MLFYCLEENVLHVKSRLVMGNLLETECQTATQNPRINHEAPTLQLNLNTKVLV